MAQSAVDIVGPAFERMKRQIFDRFQASQWLRLALLGALTGEMGSAGGCNLRTPFTSLPGGNNSPAAAPHLPGLPNPLVILGILVLIVLGIALAIGLTYISSRMRFVLFDSIVAGECRIRQFWSQRGEPGFRYFLWQLAMLLILIATVAGLFIIVLAIGIAMGWFADPRDHVVPLVVAGLLAVLSFLAVLVVFATVMVFTKDFVVPQMALENVGAVEGWRRLWPMIMREKGSYAGYVGMKFVLALGSAVVLGIVTFIVFLILLLPVGGVGALVVLWAKGAGASWTPVTIALAILAGAVLITVLVVIGALISVPAIVFFPVYSMYFFADRYPPLKTLFFPPAPPAGSPF